jgi:hypothetical protein
VKHFVPTPQFEQHFKTPNNALEGRGHHQASLKNRKNPLTEGEDLLSGNCGRTKIIIQKL